MLMLTGTSDGPGPIRRFLLPGLFVLALFVALYMRRPGTQTVDTNAPIMMTVSGPTMGTSYTVKLVGPSALTERQSEIKAAIESSLQSVNSSMSTYIKTSEISRFNTNTSTKPVEVSSGFLTVLDRALTISKASNGAFDATVGPLVNAWGFGPDGERKDPSDDEIDALKSRTGMHLITIDPSARTVTKQQSDLAIDLSAIAKGYGVDEIARALDRLKIENYLVEIVGELRARGQSRKIRPWRVGIEKPVSDRRAIQEVIALDNQSMATSGDYRNYREVDGKRISHTIDPRTGRPIEHTLASVTVISADCAGADGWATALNVLGSEAGLKTAQNNKLAALFIIRQPDGTFKEEMTAAFKSIRERSKAPNP